MSLTDIDEKIVIYQKVPAQKNCKKKERATKPFLKVQTKKRERVDKEKSLLNDLKYLTIFNHTGALEVYQSLYNKYCPKRLHF